MKTIYYKRLLKPLLVVIAILLAACSSDTATDESAPLPDGMGRIRISICTPENNSDITRAVNTTTTWLEPNQNWEKLHSFRILIFDKTTGKLEDIIESTEPTMTASPSDPSYQYATVTSGLLPAGTYYVYATANCHKSVNANDAYDDGFVKGNTYTKATIDAMTLKLANGYSEKNIPMSGKLTTAPGGNTLREVTVTAGSITDVTDTPLTVWRMLSKLQFEFTNDASTKVRVYGVEVEPINQASSSGPGVYLFSKDDLTSENNLEAGTGIHLPAGAKADKGTTKYESTTPLLTLDAKGGTTPTGIIFFYVNETDATFTTTENQFSVRFKIKRLKSGKSGDDPTDWYDDEIRYGLTTNHDGTSGGFNVIRRNDWIHIPVKLTDWMFRIDILDFVPIAGYPASKLSSDALSATFETGGLVALRPLVKKFTDATWRKFSDSEVTLVDYTWKNVDGVKQKGTKKIIKEAYAYDDVNNCFIFELNTAAAADLDAGAGEHMTTLTVNLLLGPSGSQYPYSFSCNIILKK